MMVVVTNLEQIQLFSKLRVFFPHYKTHQGSPQPMLNYGVLDEIQNILNKDDSRKNWEDLARNLGFQDSTILTWEKSGNPIKCLLHTWMSDKDANVKEFQELLKLLGYYELAAKISVLTVESY